MGFTESTDLSLLKHKENDPELSAEAKKIAEYIYKNKKLPDNFLLKSEAPRKPDGNGYDIEALKAAGLYIGGDRFRNEEGLPESGGNFYECDHDYSGGSRGPNRFVFNDAGMVYCIQEHYNEFYLIFPTPPKVEDIMIALGGTADKHDHDIVDKLLDLMEDLFTDQINDAEYMMLSRELRTINKEMSGVLNTTGGINTNGKYLKYYSYAEEIMNSLYRHVPELLFKEEFFRETIEQM